VLLQLQRELQARATNISLSSLSSIDPDLDVAADRDGRPLPTTNFIQKEVVKQILYSGRPEDFPESRYSRTSQRGDGPDLAFAGAGMASWVFVSGLTRLPAAVATTFFGGNIRASWAVILVAGFFIGAAAYKIFGALKRRFSIQSVTAGPAAITLQDRNTYFFDEYLDEIVYYFEASRTDVVIFEDIDRFDDSHIFESLRNLNVVLNNSSQVNRPIYFIYAVRDSIFDSSQSSRGSRSAVDTAGSRTKFFDAIIPLVPFITHRTARDLLDAEMKGNEHKPSHAVITAVAEQVSDMRLLRNVVNEYRVFARELLQSGDLEDLTPEALFVMVGYKNLAPEDFERIRSGSSNLDFLQDQLETLATQRIRAIDVEIARAKKNRGHVDPSDVALRARVEAFLNRVDAMTMATWSTSYLGSFQVDTETFSANPRNRAALIEAILDADEITFGNMTLNTAQMETLAGGPLARNRATKESDREIDQRIERLIEERARLSLGNFASFIRSATMFDTNVGQRSARQIARSILGTHADLWIKMIASGHLDQNYTLYTARYYGTALSPDGLSFVIRNVQRNKADFERHFIRSEDIRTILEERDESFFREDSALNLEIVDFLTREGHPGLRILADRLSESDELSRDFLSTYIRSNTSAELWSLLSDEWPHTIEFLAQEEGLQDERAVELISGTLEISKALAIEEPGAKLVRRLVNSLPSLKENLTEIVARRVAKRLSEFEAFVDDVRPLPLNIREAIISRGAYRITRENILEAVNSDAIPALDRLRSDKEHVYYRILREAAAFIECREIDDEPLILDETNSILIIGEVSKASPESMTAFAASLGDNICVSDLGALPTAAQLPIFASGHAAVTTLNLALLVGDTEVIPAEALPILEQEQDFTDEDAGENVSLATLIVNDVRISAAARTALVGSMQLSLPVESLTVGDALGALVGLGALEDDAVTALKAAEFGARVLVEFVVASSDWGSIASRLPNGLSPVQVDAIVSCEQVSDSDIAATIEMMRPWRISDRQIAERAARRAASAAALTLTPTTIEWLASRGADVSDVLILLARILEELSLTQIYSVTDLMGRDFARLSSPRGRAMLPDTPDVVALLERLRVPNGYVTSFKQVDGHLRVGFKS
jgi:hypothetical protein